MNLIRPPSKLRTLLTLGRVSNLPTVWSNCLAGWWLAGGRNALQLASVTLAVSYLYLGGMFLNDAFDAGFDRQHRRTRPIPSGAISGKEVWQWGFSWLALGVAGLVWTGKTTAILTLLLTVCILFYNAIHKLTGVAPVLMGACRCLVYLVAASVTRDGVTGYVLWCGLALACYVMGLSWLARREIWRGGVPFWPVIPLAAPLVLAALVDDGGVRMTGLILALLLVIWVLWALRWVFSRREPVVGSAVSGLLGGIVLVDCLAVADLSLPRLGLFLCWFLLAVLLQFFIPAT